MEIGAAFVAGPESFEPVEPGEGALDDPAGFAQAGAVGDAAAGDEGLDAALPQQSAVLRRQGNRTFAVDFIRALMTLPRLAGATCP